MNVDDKCNLCFNEAETLDHLFWPTIQFSLDEAVACQLVPHNGIDFYDFSKKRTSSSRYSWVVELELSKELGSHFAAYVAESVEGLPASVQMYACEKNSQSRHLATHIFPHCNVKRLTWNKGSTHLLVVAYGVDDTNPVRHGALSCLTTDGRHIKVIRSCSGGPIWDVQWSYTGNEFAVIYGFSARPASAKVFDKEGQSLYDLGPGCVPYTTIRWSPKEKLMDLWCLHWVPVVDDKFDKLLQVDWKPESLEKHDEINSEGKKEQGTDGQQVAKLSGASITELDNVIAILIVDVIKFLPLLFSLKMLSRQQKLPKRHLIRLMTEEEIKALQNQVMEMNILRESNMQLREENRHNFEECQKLREVAEKSRIQSETLESQLMERQIELEASKKEIEMVRTERDLLGKRVSEEILKEKAAQIKEIMRLLSKKQDTISKLEQDLASSKLELNEKDKKLNDNLGNIKSDMEKQKKLVLQYKGKATVLSELEKYQQALKRFTEEVEKLKHAEGNLPEGTSVVQLVFGTKFTSNLVGGYS
ncbi:hypothetical protein CCACVL1_24933 [Corchorus capsularis]|uniref:Translation initiation factor beta propellor-like domain-containing protein n=1 Tax=Corchorus capsularis TaxID=210143 RepID=A0A1R3GMS2_COCAP|nr:hypothetical protein CCACVL1_24933 [Corchorus capsularis]